MINSRKYVAWFRDSLALVLSDQLELVGGVWSVAAHSRETVRNGKC